MREHYVKLTEAEYNGAINALTYLADNIARLCPSLNEKVVTELTEVAKKIRERFLKRAIANPEDVDFGAGVVYWIRVFICDDDIREIARIIAVIMIANDAGYDTDYAVGPVGKLQAFIALHEHESKMARDALVAQFDDGCKQHENGAFAIDVGESDAHASTISLE